MRILPALILFVVVSVPTAAQSAADLNPFEATSTRAGWMYFDAPLWDISNEGLPFRLTLALPSRRDPLTRMLFADEARWTFSIGYVKVYNSYDRATGIFKNPGGHAAMVSAGRQFRWDVARLAGPFAPAVALEVGAHYATHRFPADGTRPNFKVIPGLEWTWGKGGNETVEWSAGVMWLHFSNANLFARNSGYDGLVFRLGRSIRF